MGYVERWSSTRTHSIRSGCRGPRTRRARCCRGPSFHVCWQPQHDLSVGWDMPGERTESTASRTPYEDAFAPLVYEELRRIAHRHLRSERPGHTLSTTALLHESYLKLAEQTRAVFRDRTHFLVVASQGMRRILIDYARGHRAARRGGDHQ